MCDRVVSKGPFMLICCPDKYETQKMCDETVDNCLAALEFIPHWFVTSKMLEKFHNVSLGNDDILFFEKKFSKITFFVNQNLDKINLDDGNKEDDSETIIHVKLLAWRSKFENTKHL